MITGLFISGLFQRFDYSIVFKDRDVTILTGPNGYGKTTILKSIEAISKTDIAFFERLSFDSIRAEFDNGKVITLKKDVEKQQLVVNDNIFITRRDVSDELLDDEQLRWLRRISKDEWIDVRSEEVLNWTDILMRYPSITNRLYSIHEETKSGMEVSELVEILHNYCGEVRLISEQRLIKQDDDYYRWPRVRKTVDVISGLPEKLKTEMSKVIEKYSTVANHLDRSYPKRLLSANEFIANEEEYRKSMKDVQEKFDKLSKYKLVEMDILQDEEYNDSYAIALKIYFDDFAKKYEVFKVLIDKLDLFTRIINTRLEFKQVEVSRQSGFQIIDTETNNTLQLASLSSGEKQEIVLFYELIFGIDEGLVFLIDEPEISLHVSWQRGFLNDLLEIAKLSRVKAIVSTHAPEIISDHLDIQVDLGELYENAN